MGRRKKRGRAKKKKKVTETVSEVDWVRTVLSYVMSFAFIGVAIWMVYSPEFLGLGSEGPETLDEMAEEETLKQQEEIPDVEIIDFECEPGDTICEELLGKGEILNDEGDSMDEEGGEIPDLDFDSLENEEIISDENVDPEGVDGDGGG